MSTASIPSPFNLGDFSERCPVCNKPAHFIEIDELAEVEIYRCPCGELEFEEPIIEN